MRAEIVMSGPTKKTAIKKSTVKKKLSSKKSTLKLSIKISGKTKLAGQLSGAVKICDSAFKKMVSTQQAFIKAEAAYVKAKGKVSTLQQKITDQAAKD
jgi:hypothetical protein